MKLEQWLAEANAKVQSFERAEGLTPEQTYGIMEYGGEEAEKQRELRLSISSGGYWLPGLRRMQDLRED